MRILYAIHEFFPEFYTGTARVGLYLAKQMQKMGHQVKVLTYGLTETDGLIPIGDLCYKKYEYESIQVISLRHKNLYPQINFNIFCYDIEDEIRQLINVESLDDIDLVHIIHPLRMGIVAKIFNEKNIPIIMTLTDYWTVCPRVQLLKPDYSLCNGPDGGKMCSEMCGYSNQEMENRLRDTKSLFDLADIITVPTNLVKRIFDINGFNDEKIKVVNHGLSYEYFTSKNLKNPSDNDLVTFAFIGPILKHKGVHILIEAFRKISLSNIRLVIYGHYFHERSYFEYIQKISDTDNRIKIFGRFNYEDLSEIYSSVDVAVFPSVWYETYCIALSEATAHKVPVIAANTIGAALEHLKDGVNGFIFEMGNDEKLADVIELIGKDPTIISRLKENVSYPPRIEEEAFQYDLIYKEAGPTIRKKKNGK